jgi:replicative DNA helicase
MSAELASRHAEAFVLAASLAPRWFDDIALALPRPEMFYVPRHQAMYRAIAELHTTSQGIDATTIEAALRRRDGIGDAPSQWTRERIERFVAATPSEVLNYASHAEEVRAQWVRREVIRSAREAQIAAQDQAASAHDALDRAQSDLAHIAESATRSTPPDLRAVARAAVDLISTNRVRRHTGGLVGMPSGIHALDRVTYGWIAPRYVIIGARTSIGKTSLLFSHVANATAAGYGAVVYSWEESPETLFIRLAAIRARVNGQRAIVGDLDTTDQGKLDGAMGQLAIEPLEIIDATGWNALDVRAHARSLKRRMPSLKLVGIDYVQKIRAIDTRLDERGRVRETSNALFHLAHDSELVVMCLAQLNRQAQGRADKRPEQSDLKEAGNLEEDADSIVLIHRPEYDGIEFWDNDPSKMCEGQARLLLTKHRGGQTAAHGITVAFHKERAEFADLDFDRTPPQTHYGGHDGF